MSPDSRIVGLIYAIRYLFNPQRANQWLQWYRREYEAQKLREASK